MEVSIGGGRVAEESNRLTIIGAYLVSAPYDSNRTERKEEVAEEVAERVKIHEKRLAEDFDLQEDSATILCRVLYDLRKARRYIERQVRILEEEAREEIRTKTHIDSIGEFYSEVKGGGKGDSNHTTAFLDPDSEGQEYVLITQPQEVKDE